MTEKRQMQEIVQVTAAVRAAAEARMAALRAEEAALRQRIKELDAAFRARAFSATAEDAALRAGVDLRWEQWVESRRAGLLAELARLRARIEDERLTLAREFGRNAVAEELLREIGRGFQQQRDRQADRG